jgi:hypothetical protein
MQEDNWAVLCQLALFDKAQRLDDVISEIDEFVGAAN